MKVLVAGASGFIGSELLAQLTLAGHEIATLTRGEDGPGRHHWDPATSYLAPAIIAWADTVVNLAGASLNQLPWTPKRRDDILTSRLLATNLIVDRILASSAPPAALLNGSAVGIYGHRPGETLADDAPAAGDSFLREVVEQWEAAAHRADDTTRVVTLRTGVVVGRGGAFTPLELLTKVGLAGRLGPGTQHWPWIALHDEAAAIVHLLTSTLSGAVNLEGPTPATAQHITDALAERMHRPHLFAVPSVALGLLLGQAARELLLSDQKAVPTRLLADGFEFRYPTIEDAIAATF